jgi:tRNA-dihydrouridine synthase 1
MREEAHTHMPPPTAAGGFSFPHRFVVAPMVGVSDLPFRVLCRRHGADLCYTPMLYARKYIDEPSYREESFQTCAADRPLVVQFAANNAQDLLQAGLLLQDQCDAIDINLGCPQREARSMRYGAYLLDEEDRECVLEMVRVASAGLRVPVFCKIRLLETLEETIRLALQLENAGCKLLCVHGRTRGSPEARRAGPADLAQIWAVKERCDTHIHIGICDRFERRSNYDQCCCVSCRIAAPCCAGCTTHGSLVCSLTGCASLSSRMETSTIGRTSCGTYIPR